MTSNHSRILSTLRNSNIMSIRLYFPIHARGPNRNCLIKLLSRYYITRHLLCNGTFSLRSKNGSYFRVVCRFQPLVSSDDRTSHSPSLISGPILYYVYWSKRYLFPPTLLGLSRHTTTVLRLPRRLHPMKCCIIRRIYDFRSSSSLLYFHRLRKTSVPATHYYVLPSFYLIRMTRLCTS